MAVNLIIRYVSTSFILFNFVIYCIIVVYIYIHTWYNFVRFITHTWSEWLIGDIIITHGYVLTLCSTVSNMTINLIDPVSNLPEQRILLQQNVNDIFTNRFQLSLPFLFVKKANIFIFFFFQFERGLAEVLSQLSQKCSWINTRKYWGASRSRADQHYFSKFTLFQ